VDTLGDLFASLPHSRLWKLCLAIHEAFGFRIGHVICKIVYSSRAEEFDLLKDLFFLYIEFLCLTFQNTG
jgi:hypothetical protein